MITLVECISDYFYVIGLILPNTGLQSVKYSYYFYLAVEYIVFSVLKVSLEGA